jgi:mannose-6-phosphate isomerase-like protein (cupin superfamily)
MEFVRFDSSKAAALPGGANAMYVPVQQGDKLVAMVIQLDRKGDTGKREVGVDTLLTVIEGEARLRSGGEIVDLKTGDVVVLPGGILHQVWTSDSRIQLVMLELGGKPYP